MDWTITDAPQADEFLPAESPSSFARQRLPPSTSLTTSQKVWLISGSLIVLFAAGLWLSSTYTTWRIRREVTQVVKLEEQAAWAGDMRRYVEFSDDSNRAWIIAQTWLADRNQPAPAPLPGLQPLPNPGTIRTPEFFAANIIRVDVAREFQMAGRATLTFTLPQFYRYTRGAWRRIPPPETFWGEPQDRVGRRLILRYYTADATFAKEDLGPYLDDVLQKACTAWACSNDLTIGLNLVNYAYQPGDSLLFRPFGENLFLPSPHAQGYPADSETSQQFKQTIALWTLYSLADQVTRADGGQNQTGNAFFRALAARAAARLGLLNTPLSNAPTLSSLYTYTPRQLWCAYCGASTPEETIIAEWEAHALLDQLLRGQPAEIEDRLFVALRSATGPVMWLAQGMSLSTQEAKVRLDAALQNVQSSAP